LTPQKEKWAGLDSNQRRLTPTGLQPVATKSQATEKQQLTTQGKSSVQTSVQTKSGNGLKSTTNKGQKLPADLAEIVVVWPELPEHIKAAIKALVQTHSKGTK
jgi:hypothetical protein